MGDATFNYQYLHQLDKSTAYLIYSFRQQESIDEGQMFSFDIYIFLESRYIFYEPHLCYNASKTRYLHTDTCTRTRTRARTHAHTL